MASSSNDLTISIKTAFGADNSELRKALGTITIDAERMADGFSSAAANASKAFDTIGLGANAQVGRLQRFHDGFQALTGKIGAGLGAIDDFAKALGPWNQALELGGKAIKFLGEGMDAYAKTSPEARREVEAIKNEFGKLKDSVMSAVGEMTVGALKPLPSLKELEEQLKAVARAGGDVKKAAEESSKAYGFFSSIVSGKFIGQITGSSDPWDTGMTAGEARDKAIAWYNQQRQAQQAAGKKAAGTDKVGKQMGWSPPSAPGPTFDATMEQLDLSTKSITGGALSADQLAQMGALNLQIGNLAGSVGQLTAAAQVDTGPSLLERLGLHNPEAWDLARAAVESTTAGISDALRAFGEGSLGGAKAARRALGMIVSGIGDHLAAMAASEAVIGAAQLVTLNPMGFLHLGAAGLLGAGAVAAYATAKALGGSGGSAAAVPTVGAGGGGGGGGGGGRSTSGPDSGARQGGGSGSGDGGRTMIIVYGDSYAEDSPRMRQVRAEQLVKKATGTSAAVHS